MQDLQQKVNTHYGLGDLIARIDEGLVKAGKDLKALSVDDLAPVDEFHTRGRESTDELAALAIPGTEDRVLDVGCGLGGTARHLARVYGCKVEGIDLTAEYVATGQELTRRVGLEDKVHLQQASALELPFDDGTFDIVWTEHVQMNIPEKERFYSEISRVLKKGGRLLFHDIFRGTGESPVYPAPWAEDESLSHLATEAQAKSAIASAGLQVNEWRGKVEESIEFFSGVFQKIEADGAPPIGIHLLMGDNAGIKLRNYVTNMTENRLSVVMGVAVKQ